MADKCVLEPDLHFIRAVVDQGGEAVKKCYQCSTCAVICPISPDENPFPRKEMIWAQWGFRDKIFQDPGLWLCHQCNDCSIHCPRGAKPGNVLAALRSLFIQHHTFPAFLARVISRKSLLAVALLIPILILGGVLLLLHSTGLLNQHPGHVEYANMMPHLALNTLFTALLFFVALVFAVAIFRYWTGMSRSAGISCTLNMGSLKKSIWPALKEIITHEKFRKCTTTRSRYLAHLLVLYSFVGLLVTTAAAVFYIVFFHYYPLALTNGFKMLGNISAVAMLIGLIIMIWERLAGEKREKVGAGNYFDWLFLVVLLVVVITGALCEIFRLTDIAIGAYPTYFIHLVAVFFLLIYSPYSKFAHLVYRTVAMVFSKYVELEKAKGGIVCTP